MLPTLFRKIRPRPKQNFEQLSTEQKSLLCQNFDSDYYNLNYPDVVESGCDPFEHFCNYGWKEGRNPNSSFSTNFYLENNPDVALLGLNPLLHYLEFGQDENRECSAVASVEKEPPKECPAVDVDPIKDIRSLLKPHFDDQYYSQLYPEVASQFQDLLLHYCLFGWKEGRNPNVAFSSAYYLEQYQDVAESGINPLLHYSSFGKAEGRFTKPPDKFDYARQLFDSEYYLRTYTDLTEAEIDPFGHYLYTGWQEGRNPSQWFDTEFYTEQYPEVLDSGENPLVHYAISGVHKSYLTKHPVRIETFGQMRHHWEHPLDQIEQEGESSNPELTLNELHEILMLRFDSRFRSIALSFSHDLYIENCGGIQSFISREHSEFKKLQTLHINISPKITSRLLSKARQPAQMRVDVTIDGESLGSSTLADLSIAILEVNKRSQIEKSFCIIHSLLGHSPESISCMLKELSFINSIHLWVHDYSTICPSYALMRNDVEFCAGPETNCQSCRVCSYGSYRAEHLKRVEDLFHSHPINLVAPSDTSLDIWRNSAHFPTASQTVLQHYSYSHSSAQKIQKPSVNSPLKVAFCGTTVFHKGWQVFKSILEDTNKNSTLFDFHHFATSPYMDFNCSGHAVSVTKDQPNAMVDALREQNIRLVLIPALWPETFCYVALEAIRAGCVLATIEQSGNVAKLAEHFKQVIVFPSESALIQAFSSNEIYQSTISIFSSGFAIPEFTHSGTTASLVDFENTDEPIYLSRRGGV